MAFTCVHHLYTLFKSFSLHRFTSYAFHHTHYCSVLKVIRIIWQNTEWIVQLIRAINYQPTLSKIKYLHKQNARAKGPKFAKSKKDTTPFHLSSLIEMLKSSSISNFHWLCPFKSIWTLFATNDGHLYNNKNKRQRNWLKHITKGSFNNLMNNSYLPALSVHFWKLHYILNPRWPLQKAIKKQYRSRYISTKRPKLTKKFHQSHLRIQAENCCYSVLGQNQQA